jgi:hypothetical protein
MKCLKNSGGKKSPTSLSKRRVYPAPEDVFGEKGCWLDKDSIDFGWFALGSRNKFVRQDKLNESELLRATEILFGIILYEYCNPDLNYIERQPFYSSTQVYDDISSRIAVERKLKEGGPNIFAVSKYNDCNQVFAQRVWVPRVP